MKMGGEGTRGKKGEGRNRTRMRGEGNNGDKYVNGRGREERDGERERKKRKKMWVRKEECRREVARRVDGGSEVGMRERRWREGVV